MKNIIRQKPPGTKLKMNLCANAAQVRHVLEHGGYQIRIESARVIFAKTGNILVALDAVETAGNRPIAIQPLWIAGPNAADSTIAAENQALLAQLLEFAGQNTSGEIDIENSVPKLVGLIVSARLSIELDSRTGRSHNSIVAVYTEGAS